MYWKIKIILLQIRFYQLCNPESYNFIYGTQFPQVNLNLEDNVNQY